MPNKDYDFKFKLIPKDVRNDVTKKAWQAAKDELSSARMWGKPYHVDKFTCCIESNDGNYMTIYNEKRKIIVVYAFPDYSHLPSLASSSK